MIKEPFACTRREFSRGLLASLALAALSPAHALTVRGVRLGVQTYSFHKYQMGGESAVAEIAAALKRLNVSIVELFCPQIEPFATPVWSWNQWRHASTPAAPQGQSEKQQREQLRHWRMQTPDSYFARMRAQFTASGVQIYCYNYSFQQDMTDAEIHAGFRQARLLGATYITASSKLSVAQRVAPYAREHNMHIGWHNHADLTDPDAICTPASLARLMRMSPLYGVNMDIGHFTTAGFDPVAYIDKEHTRISNLHMKDRMKNGGENRPFGKGETNVAGVLHLLRDKHYDIPAMVEYEYLGTASPEEEIARALKFEENILQS